MKYIILRNDKDDMIFSYIKDDNIYDTFKYKKNNKWYHMIMKYNFPFSKLLYGSWKKKIKECDTVILFDTMMYPCVTKYIRKHNKKCKIILYFWNSIDEKNKYLLSDKNIDKYYTFDKKDANKYKLAYNQQFYTKNIKIYSKSKIDYDILFLGREKGRKKELLKFKNICVRNKINIDLNIISKESDLINYDTYLDMLKRYKIILDIVVSNQNGLSLRAMESLFLKKKLITNNKSIVEYDFYDKNNIFILGVDNMEDLKKFVNTPYKQVDKKIIDNYEYKSWLKRFEE